MRLLVDERDLDWDEAWQTTVATFGYTNHTLLPEALETWPLEMFAESLPRHLEIIYEINRRFLDEVRAKFPTDEDRVRRMSLIGEDNGKSVRMAHLATIGSHAINGVAALHSELLKESVLKDFFELWPERFGNKTNGVTPRRFLALANPGLCELLDRTIGDGWLTDLGRLRGLEPFVEEAVFRAQWRDIKRSNKSRLAKYIRSETGIELNADWMFDVQVKRIHEYKRQHLNMLHIVALYHRLKQNPGLSIPQRAFIFGGKAAPGYFMAKRIIKLINAVGETVNADPDVSRLLKVAFVPNFSVKNAHMIYPAADLSEQISTAGKEASGTGNMKFMINGALTIGTLDGANVEIREEVGPENFFLFRSDRVRGAGRQGQGLPPVGLHRRKRRAARGAGSHCRGDLLTRRHRGVQAAGGQPALRRPLLGLRRLCLLRELPGAGERRMAGQGLVDEDVHPEYRTQRQVLVGSGHCRVLRRNLECLAAGRDHVSCLNAESPNGRSTDRPSEISDDERHVGCDRRGRDELLHARPRCHPDMYCCAEQILGVDRVLADTVDSATHR